MKDLKLKSPSLKHAYMKSLLIWNPLWVFVISLFLGGFHDLRNRLAVSFLIATLTMHFCFGVVVIARFIVRNFTQLGAENPLLKSKAWSFSVSLFAMPLGLYFSFKMTDIISPFLGLHGSPANADDYRMGMFIGTLIAGLYFLLETRREAKENARKTELKIKEIENERLQAQISALTAQMNPHLLFNALNTVAALVPTDPKKAEETIVKLSELYRGVLDSSRNMTHPLSTELGLCEAYLSIEKVRFGERLTSETEIAQTLDINSLHVPALSLQPLVENAVKHGLAPLAKGGKIWISAKIKNGSLQILIEDNGVGLSQSKRKTGGAGTGMKNCQERLKLHFGALGIFDVADRTNGGTIVSVTMPITQGFTK